jgi:YidC/Oxa1 family membrane protein insertase
MASEMQALYKKHNIHPFLSILVMIIQFPVFICVWGAMTGSSVLSSDAFLGLRLSESVSSIFFDFSNWPNNPGWWTAVVIFFIMAVLQVVAMLLPQIISKKKQAKIAKLGKNPAAKKQGNKMKMFTIIMCVMIIFMGFSLASGMVIYWIAGSIWSIAQTLIIELISYLKNNKKNKPKKPSKNRAVTQDGVVVDAEVTPAYMQAPTRKKKYKDKE